MISRRLTLPERIAWKTPGFQVLDGWRSHGGAIHVLILRRRGDLIVKAVAIAQEGGVRSIYEHEVEREEWMEPEDQIDEAFMEAKMIKREWSKLLRPLGISHDSQLDSAALSGVATVIHESMES